MEQSQLCEIWRHFEHDLTRRSRQENSQLQAAAAILCLLKYYLATRIALGWKDNDVTMMLL